MRQLTQREREAWIEQSDFVAPAVEILTALFAGDHELAQTLAQSCDEEMPREAHLWLPFHAFLRERNWIGVWDDFCLYLAQMRADVACGGEIGYWTPEDELAQIVSQWGDQEEDE